MLFEFRLTTVGLGAVTKGSGRNFAGVGSTEGEHDLGRAFNGGSCSCADKYPAEVLCSACGRLF